MKITLVPKSPVRFRGETSLLDFDGHVIPSTPIRLELGAQDEHPDAPSMGVCLDTSFLDRNVGFQKCVLGHTKKGDTELGGQFKCMVESASAAAGQAVAKKIMVPVLLTGLGALAGVIAYNYLTRR